MSRQVNTLRSLSYLLLFLPLLALADVLPSWRDGPSRQSIEAFVGAVTTQGSETYIEPTDRIAVFDNDGTLWSEQPLYFRSAVLHGRGQAPGAAAPRMEDSAALQGSA
jgi:hypothetical protein